MIVKKNKEHLENIWRRLSYKKRVILLEKLLGDKLIKLVAKELDKL